jgi:hypothetical protein
VLACGNRQKRIRNARPAWLPTDVTAVDGDVLDGAIIDLTERRTRSRVRATFIGSVYGGYWRIGPFVHHPAIFKPAEVNCSVAIHGVHIREPCSICICPFHRRHLLILGPVGWRISWSAQDLSQISADVSLGRPWGICEVGGAVARQRRSGISTSPIVEGRRISSGLAPVLGADKT